MDTGLSGSKLRLVRGDRPLDCKTRALLGELARVLPQAAGREWCFVLRPDAGRFADWPRERLGRLAARRALLDALSPSFAECRAGAGSRTRAAGEAPGTHGQLSITYGVAAATLDVDSLKADWAKAQPSMWPLRGIRSKAVVKLLMASSDCSREPDAAADLDRLAVLRVVARHLEALALAVSDAGPV